ncbi:hypothetical protein [Reinekea sp. G2M2-21]|uniref:hypothetical protein n=1 Tax=Reinekea sp. G2M2-21 TaxID=2788942 RepID=UPI0018A8ECE2|nr:hypothetical protein [Reinekea sp. G2M2-21]
MWSLLKYTLIYNLIAATVIIVLRLASPYVASFMWIDTLFLTGVFFWLISTIVRLSSKRFKKEWNRNEVIVTDPQIVLHSNSLAARFLAAGLPGILGAIIWGFFY